MFGVESRGSFDKTEAWLKGLSNTNAKLARLNHFGAAGVAALRAATPVEDGETAAGWYYEVVQDATSYALVWGNSYIVDGQVIAVLLQYGHGTGTGGWVEGRDYINPAMKPIFDQMVSEGWKVVTE